MNFIKSLLGFFLLVLVFSSCISNKKLIYLQNLPDREPIFDEQLISYEIPEYRLQFNDIIRVEIKTVDDFLESGFSSSLQQMNNMGMGGMMGAGDIFYLTGYSVDQYGFVRLPIVGQISVLNMTLEEARAVIEEKIREFVTTDLYVKIQLGGIRFATLGQFNAPGKYVVLQERLTILEAIATAGDLTNLAKRDDLMLIRQYPDGSKIHRVNLRDRNLISSPFYFIQPNDQLYAEPMKVRELGSGETAVQSLSLFVSTFTAVGLILAIILN
ncbi:polysaccharide biosynthesis/export family protein [Mongoliitalea lutea]|uniref:Sugar transporter n=1 Tax=Mongoliitalea lutea TaxID=849756 RepID=A0A8J3CW31_9BACT|nr:polysaccharide biosynthesis/export family protein [Mongoliitalea lutea]GHB37280.1 sugar transporter [Mongoliitalea lutea]